MEKKTNMNIKQAARFLEKNPSMEDFMKATTALNDEERAALAQAAIALNDARKVVANYTKDERISVDTFRCGFIGKKISDENGSEFVQTRRGKPYGYIAAIFKDGKIYAGYTFVNPTEKYTHPMIGQALALKNAVRNHAQGITIEDLLSEDSKFFGTHNMYLRSEAKLFLKHYYDRVRRYFMPETYSFSRGSDPIQDPNFANIHAYQFAQAAIEAKTQEEFETALRRFKDMLLLRNPNLKDTIG